MFYDTYVKLCKSVGKTPSAVAVEIGIGKSNVTYWKNGRNGPTDITLAKIADYFNVTVAELKGEEQKENPTSQKTDEVDEVTMELLDIINSVTHEERQDMLEMLRIMQKRRDAR